MTAHDNSYSFKFELIEDVDGMVNEARFKPKGLGEVVFEDDVVVVYTPTGKEEYKGIFDYCPYRYDHMEYDERTKSYRIIGDNGDYRIMVKVA